MLEWLPLVQQILTPLLGSTSQLITDLASGAKSLAVARAELAGILSVATTRLNNADKGFAARDTLQDARVKADTEPTKP